MFAFLVMLDFKVRGWFGGVREADNTKNCLSFEFCSNWVLGYAKHLLPHPTQIQAFAKSLKMVCRVVQRS